MSTKTNFRCSGCNKKSKKIAAWKSFSIKDNTKVAVCIKCKTRKYAYVDAIERVDK